MTWRKRPHAPAPSSAAASSSDARDGLQAREKDDHRVPGELPDSRRTRAPGAPSAGSPRSEPAARESKRPIQSSATATQLTTYALKTLARTKREEAPGRLTRSASARPSDIVPGDDERAVAERAQGDAQELAVRGERAVVRGADEARGRRAGPTRRGSRRPRRRWARRRRRRASASVGASIAQGCHRERGPHPGLIASSRASAITSRASRPVSTASSRRGSTTSRSTRKRSGAQGHGSTAASWSYATRSFGWRSYQPLAVRRSTAGRVDGHVPGARRPRDRLLGLAHPAHELPRGALLLVGRRAHQRRTSSRPWERSRARGAGSGAATTGKRALSSR